MSKLSFKTILGEKAQKRIFDALQDLEAAFSTLEDKANEAFNIIDEIWTEVDEEIGEDHPFSNLLHSLKAHIEEITSSFDPCDNFDKEEKAAFTEWYESMMK